MMSHKGAGQTGCPAKFPNVIDLYSLQAIYIAGQAGHGAQGFFGESAPDLVHFLGSEVGDGGFGEMKFFVERCFHLKPPDYIFSFL
jgi:hypothetical protein